MSILIRGMEMPKAGNWKTIRIYNDGTCAEPNWQGDCKYMQGCEAIPIPPHGRLIDADALENRVVPASRFFDIPNANVVVLGVIKAAPTIIPASEEG